MAKEPSPLHIYEVDFSIIQSGRIRVAAASAEDAVNWARSQPPLHFSNQVQNVSKEVSFYRAVGDFSDLLDVDYITPAFAKKRRESVEF